MILSLFTQNNSILCVVIATIAFSMGIDCPDIHHIIHWGAACNLEHYFQEWAELEGMEKLHMHYLFVQKIVM